MALRTQQPVDAADNPILDDEVYEPITAFGCGHPDGYWASFGPSVRVRGYEVKRAALPPVFLADRDALDGDHPGPKQDVPKQPRLNGPHVLPRLRPPMQDHTVPPMQPGRQTPTLGADLSPRTRTDTRRREPLLAVRRPGKGRRPARRHHVIPASVGGSSLRQNLRAAHASCNERRGNQPARHTGRGEGVARRTVSG